MWLGNRVLHNEGKKVVLIDGHRLTRLMIDYQVGVTPSRTYILVDVSEDFFAEEE